MAFTRAVSGLRSASVGVVIDIARPSCVPADRASSIGAGLRIGVKGRFAQSSCLVLGRSVAEELLALREPVSAPCLGLARRRRSISSETARADRDRLPVVVHRHHRQAVLVAHLLGHGVLASTRTPTSIEVLQTAFTEAMQRISSPT